MPTSALAHAPRIVTLVDQAPGGRNILDIGPGYGKYGLLCLEYLAVKPTRLAAVEKHAPYLYEWGPRLAGIYNEVYLADGLDLGTADIKANMVYVDGVNISQITLRSDFLDGFDIVLLLDVIEHFPKDQAIALLDRIRGRVIINTPVEFFVSVEGHPTEEHVSHWTLDDFHNLGRPVEYGAIETTGIIVQLGPKPSAHRLT